MSAGTKGVTKFDDRIFSHSPSSQQSHNTSLCSTGTQVDTRIGVDKLRQVSVCCPMEHIPDAVDPQNFREDVLGDFGETRTGIRGVGVRRDNLHWAWSFCGFPTAVPMISLVPSLPSN